MPRTAHQQPALWVERPDVHEAPVARVALLAAFDGEYSYAIPPELVGRVEAGKRVLVPFGRGGKPRTAFCVSVGQDPWTNSLKLCADVLDDERLLSDHLLELGRWISRYYFTPLGRTLAAMVPEAIRRQSGFVVRRIVRPAAPEAQASGSPVEPEAPARGSHDGVRMSAKRARVLDVARAHPDGMELAALLAEAAVGKPVVSALVKAGLLTLSEQKVPAAAPNFDTPGAEPTFELGPEQVEAIARVDEVARAGAFRAVLLHGVSGSGKTEVYIHAIRAVIARGKQAILLVPEIALTTQLVQRLASRFTDVAVIHSGLTGVQRSLTWAAIARGDKKVVIGTRSAVFAPCPGLGLIVVDEEQEGSYKNLQSPRFHTRDVAIKRAQMLGIPIVLGSATPSLETWYNCERYKHFERLTLPERVAGLELPRVEFVDLQDEPKTRRGIDLLSERLGQALTETLAAGQQAILLLNKRGYASYLVCTRCKTVIVCPNCRANLVFHQTTGQALCHHCGAKMVMPQRCGDLTCGGKLMRFGMGTQRVEEELRVKFPQARIARADSDVLTKVAHYEEIVHSLQERRLDILIGTQMIAKGLDFPNVSLVGVVNAETSMHSPDFRATERTYQLVTQVAGRAGRAPWHGLPGREERHDLPDHATSPGLPGRDPHGQDAHATSRAECPCHARVIVQTLGPPSSAVRFAAQHAYAPFAAHELPIRKRLGWPPFSRLARVIVSHKRPQTAQDAAHALVAAIREHVQRHGLKAQLIGPQTAPLSRLRNLYRFDFLIRCPDANRLLETLEHLRHSDVLTPNTANALVDVDPASLL